MIAKMIPNTLKPLSVNEWFVSRILAHYWETDDVVDQLREKCSRSIPACDKPFKSFMNG